MGKHLEHCTIYAVDFDGTLCEFQFPGIGKANMKLINWLIEKRKQGDKLILWTNRIGELLEKAIVWCRQKGLEFDAVNDNIPEVVERYKDILKGRPASRKITADVFIDNSACGYGLPFGNPECQITDCWNRSCHQRKEMKRE